MGEGGEGCAQRRGGMLVNAMQMILASEAVDISLLPRQSKRLNVCLVDLLLCPVKCPLEPQSAFLFLIFFIPHQNIS